MQTFIESGAAKKVNTCKLFSMGTLPGGTNIPEQEFNLIMECAHLLEQLYPDKLILLCKKHHEIFQYAGGNSVDLWGHPKEMLESLSLEKFIGMIHPEDLDKVMWGLSKIQESVGENPADSKAVFTYRARTHSGDYLMVHDEKICVKTSKGTNAYFNIYSRAADQKSPVKIEVFKRVSGNRMIRVNEFVFTNNVSPFSTRELDVIKLLDRGFDNSAIADTLSLSIYTIKNHKQKMFRKANAKNSLELTRFARSMNLL